MATEIRPTKDLGGSLLTMVTISSNSLETECIK
jgi:hypothetical protein